MEIRIYLRIMDRSLKCLIYQLVIVYLYYIPVYLKANRVGNTSPFLMFVHK